MTKISQAKEDSLILDNFLNLLANDIKNNPSHVQPFNQTLINRAKNLTSDIEVDLDADID